MAASAGVTLDLDNCQTIARILTDTFESGEQPLVDFLLQLTGFEYQCFCLSLGLCQNLIQLRTLLVQIYRALFDVLNRLGFLCCTGL